MWISAASRWRGKTRGVAYAGALVLVLVLTGCMNWNARGALQVKGKKATSDGVLFGSYLSALEAASRRDVERASLMFEEVLLRRPGDVGLLERGLLYDAASGRMERAREKARELERLGRDGSFGLLTLGLGELEGGRFEEAAGYLGRVRARGSWVRHAALGALVWAAHGLDDEDLLSFALEERRGGDAEKSGWSAAGLGAAAEVLELRGREEEAGELWELASLLWGGVGSVDRWPWHVVLGYGEYWERRGELEKARWLYENGVTRGGAFLGLEALAYALVRVREGGEAPRLSGDARDGAARMLMKTAHDALGVDGDDAMVLARYALWLDEDLDGAWYALGERYRAFERLEEAVGAYGRTSRNSVWGLRARGERGLALEELERSSEATGELEGLTRDYAGAASSWRYLGDLHLRRKDWEEARLAYTRALELGGEGDWRLLYVRGVSGERAGRWDEAEEDFKEASRLSGGAPLVLNYLAYTWVERGEKLDEALEMLTGAVKGAPRNGHIMDSLGWAYYRLGRYDEATRRLERAVELEPINSIINDHLGDALWRTGREREAREQWRRALEWEEDEEREGALREKLARGLSDG